MVHAQLGIAQENSGKLVARVREEAYRRARDEEKPLVLIDGPPGIGCPVIAALSVVDLALLVIEPTMSGIHDFERIWRFATSACRHWYVSIDTISVPKTRPGWKIIAPSRAFR